jgi:hypothetical protein
VIFNNNAFYLIFLSQSLPQRFKCVIRIPDCVFCPSMLPSGNAVGDQCDELVTKKDSVGVFFIKRGKRFFFFFNQQQSQVQRS